MEPPRRGKPPGIDGTERLGMVTGGKAGRPWVAAMGTGGSGWDVGRAGKDAGTEATGSAVGMGGGGAGNR